MAKTTKTPRELPKGIERALGNRKPSADSEALLIDLVEIWGGTRALAKDLHTEFKGANPGSMCRQKILDMVHRLIINNTNHQIGVSLVPSDMTAEELEAAAFEYVKRVTDGSSTAP